MALSASNKKALFRVIFWTVFLSFLFLTSPYWGPMFPPRWYELHQQRKKVAERVKAAGGWQVLRRECIAFAETNEVVYWGRWRTNDGPALPPALIALRPQQVTYDSPKLLEPPNSDESPIPLVHIQAIRGTQYWRAFNPIFRPGGCCHSIQRQLCSLHSSG